MNASATGRFVRQESSFRHWVTVDGSPGPSGEAGFPAEPDRYHLYVSLACPWAHRTLLFRALKGLDKVISVSVVHPLMPAESWVFGEYPGATPDQVHGFRKLQQLYEQSEPGFDGLVTVPVLYDSYTRDLFQIPGVAETVSMDHIKRHYFGSHKSLNPSGIEPKGPDLDFDTPHFRDGFENKLCA